MKKSSVISTELFLRLKCQSDEFMTICSKLLFTDQIVEGFIELTFLMMP